MCSQPTEQPSFSLHLSVDDFIKKSSISLLFQRGIEARSIRILIQFATAEQLTAHANSIAVRFEKEDEGDSL